MFSSFKLIFSLIFIICLVSCGNDNGSSSSEISATIGPEGGVIITKDGGLILDIPAGALLEDTTITIRRLPQDEIPPEVSENGGNDVVVGYELSPDDLEFEIPALVTVVLDDEQPVIEGGTFVTNLTSLVTFSNGEAEELGGFFMNVDGDGNTSTITAELSHFSTLTAVRLDFILTVGVVPEMFSVDGEQVQPDNRFTIFSTINTTLPTDFFNYCEASELPIFLDEILEAGGSDPSLSQDITDEDLCPVGDFVGTFTGSAFDPNSPDIVRELQHISTYGCENEGPGLFHTLVTQFDQESGDVRFLFQVAIKVDCIGDSIVIQPPVCGDGIIEQDEVCELGQNIPCAEADPEFPVGDAFCSNDCTSFDASECSQQPPPQLMPPVLSPQMLSRNINHNFSGINQSPCPTLAQPLIINVDGPNDVMLNTSGVAPFLNVPASVMSVNGVGQVPVEFNCSNFNFGMNNDTFTISGFDPITGLESTNLVNVNVTVNVNP
jgi:hypothetical protein